MREDSNSIDRRPMGLEWSPQAVGATSEDPVDAAPAAGRGPRGRAPAASPIWSLVTVVAAILALHSIHCPTAIAQLEIEREPFNYGKAATNDPVTDLQKRLDAGQAQLEFDQDHGYLRSVLELLEIKTSSQVLVNSKTSFQLRRISPRRPRALFQRPVARRVGPGRRRYRGDDHRSRAG